MEKISGAERKPVQDKSPFHDLQPSDFESGSSSLYHVPGHPDMVIRKSFLYNVPETGEIHDPKQMADFWAGRTREFQNMGKKYGLRIADTQYLIGADPKTGESALLAVTERIKGKNLAEMSAPENRNIDAKLMNEVDEAYSAVLENIRDSYQNNGYMWYDPKGSQFVYGTDAKDPTPHLYVVDVDPNIFKWNDLENVTGESKEFLFFERLQHAMSAAETAERTLSLSGKYLPKTRKTFHIITEEYKTFN